jgi:hypothetical protein
LRAKTAFATQRGNFRSPFLLQVGFRAKVDNFQPVYQWTPTPKNQTSLRIGIFVLKEFQSVITQKEDAARRAKQGEKAAVQQAALKVSVKVSINS